jgi:hypothetical protein
MAMKIMKTFSPAKSTSSLQSKQVRSNQTSSRIFRLAGINEGCHATGTAEQLEESDHVPTGCLEPDYLDHNLLRSVPIRSERFSCVVTTPASENEV